MILIQRLCVLLLLVSLIVPEIVTAATIETSIDRVTIYSRGATITRTATVNVPAGESDVTFLGLPAYVNGEGLQIAVSNKKIRMGQVSFKTQQSRDVRDAEVRRLESEIAKINTEIASVSDDSKVAKLQLTFLESLATGYSKEAWVNSAQASADVSSWQQALNLMQSGSSAAYARVRDNQLKLAELEKDLDVLERSLQETRQGSKSSRSVTVSLAATSDTNSVVELQYYQPSATWYPIYEARLDSDSGELTLSQKAVIQQNGDEDWKSVKVSLSTSQPTAAMAAPSVESVFLSLRPKYQSSDSYDRGANQLEEIVVTAQKVSSSRRSRSQDVELEGAASSEEWSGSYALNFPIAGRITVTNRSSDAETYDLEKFSFPTKLITQVAPRKSDMAFLAARFTNSEKLPLQGNKMTVFVDGVLIGSTQMPTILPGEEATLPMGQDRRVQIIVSDQGGEGGNTGVISKQRLEVTDLIYEVTNRRSAETTIEVKDAYPVSRDKAIKVQIDKKSTEPDERDFEDKAGVVVWRKVLQPAETWKINQAYKVSYPSKRMVR